MGFFRFRRSIKILPGVRWNIGKKSSSFSIGVKGAHFTTGTRGTRTTVGIPGTGLSYTETSKSGQGNQNTPSQRGKRSGCWVLILIVFCCVMAFGFFSTINESLNGGSTQPPPRPSSTPIHPTVPTPEPFPASNFWPEQVHLLKPTAFSGNIAGGGVIKSTVSAGAFLPATLSDDHKSVIVHQLDLSAVVPIADTDFLQRAKKLRNH